LTSSTCRDSRSGYDHRRRREWLGESRARLLKHLVANGEVCSGGASAALLQVPAPLRVLGSWLKAIGDDDVAAGLSAAVATTSVGTEIVTNVVRSAALDAHLNQAVFAGRATTLMVQGGMDHVDLSRIVSLASLGSVGVTPTWSPPCE
jgi:hypothetical protein